MPRVTTIQSVAPDTVLPDGTIQRVITITQTLIYQTAEYAQQVTAQQQKLVDITAELPTMEAALTQSQSVIKPPTQSKIGV